MKGITKIFYFSFKTKYYESDDYYARSCNKHEPFSPWWCDWCRVRTGSRATPRGAWGSLALSPASRCRCCAGSTSPTPRRGPSSMRSSSRAACSVGPTSRWDFCTAPACWCSTSRPPASTRRAATRSSRASSSSAPRSAITRRRCRG